MERLDPRGEAGISNRPLSDYSTCVFELCILEGILSSMYVQYVRPRLRLVVFSCRWCHLKRSDPRRFMTRLDRALPSSTATVRAPPAVIPLSPRAIISIGVTMQAVARREGIGSEPICCTFALSYGSHTRVSSLLYYMPR